ncbi:MAG: rhomboid family intramembrane serine protease [Bacteroidia bacterium]
MSPIWKELRLPALVTALLWLIHLVLALLDIDPGALGIYPRVWARIWGIVTAPWVHGDLEHLLSNSLPLLLLLGGTRYFYRRESWAVIWVSWFGTGLWVWVAGRDAAHIGASGVVYGLAFFLFFSGVFRRDAQAMGLALAVALLYGGMVWGVFPIKPGLSWESHLFGALAGIVLAYYYRRHGPPRKRYAWEDEPDEDQATDTLAPWNYKTQTPPEGFRFPE